MKKIIDFFTHRIVVSVIGLIALSIIVWFVGPMIKLGDENWAPLGSQVARLVAIIVLLLLWGLNNLRAQMKNRKNNEELLEDLEHNQGMQVESDSDDRSAEELHVLNQRFSDALSTLSKLKFKGRNRSRALYELPWYIIIGPPGSGKTTALVNSTLEFPLAEQFGKEALHGVGGTRNCDWWFTNEAVLIDTAGRYTTQDSHKVVDSSAWEGFLSLLKKNRRRRPVNGVLVAISIQDLLSQTEQERSQHARTIRSRIDELMQKLEIRFPLYLMFTKTDLVSGFAEYFEDLSKEDREAVWGISLPDAPDASHSPDFDFLQSGFDGLIDRLYAREIPRIHQERDVRRRATIEAFPRQVENIRDILVDFVKQTFVKNRFEYQPYLRGVYFTSGTQDGTPIDRMMSAVSANFGFAREQVHSRQGEGKSFFLGRLFRDVIFPESELVGLNRNYEMLLRWSRRAAYLTLVVASLGLLGIWMGSISRHDAYMLEVNSHVAEFASERERIQDWNKDVRVVVPALNALANASIVYDREEHPWLSGLGLYDANVDDSADLAYHSQLRELLLPRLIHYLEAKIALGHEGGDLYHNFRSYLMFDKIENMDRDLVVEWFEIEWQREMQGEAGNRQALVQHLKNLLELDLQPYQLNPRLVRKTRELLLRVPVHQRIYSRIRTRADYRQKIDLLNAFGPSVRETFQMNESVQASLQIPFMFTRDGYESIDFSTDSPVITDIVNERWVLSDGNGSRTDFVKDDLEEISEKVEALYLAEYIKHWTDVLKVLDVAEFSSLEQASEVLSRFVDAVYSPLQAVLQVSVENTQLSPQIPESLGGDPDSKLNKATAAVAAVHKGTRVDQHFKNFNDLLRETKQSPAPIVAVMQKLEQLRDFFNDITVAPDPHKKAFQIALARYKQGAGNAITSLSKYAGNRPEPVKRWLSTISDQSWKVVLIAARQHINSEWKNQVYDFYRDAVAGRYPLSPKSKNEMAQLDFSDFFKPNGKVDKFFLSYIDPFVNTRKSWKNKSVDGRSLGLNGNALKQVRNALAIKNIYFRSNPEVPAISFQLKPYRMDKSDAQFRLDVGSQQISYKHGPKFWKDLNWAADDDNNRVRIVFEDLDDRRSEKTYEGPWAWLRLQEDSKISKTNRANEYRIEYSVENQTTGKRHAIQFLIKAKSINNPFRQKLLSAFKCPAKL